MGESALSRAPPSVSAMDQAFDELRSEFDCSDDC